MKNYSNLWDDFYSRILNTNNNEIWSKVKNLDDFVMPAMEIFD